ncbi:MAG: DUF503 domain-containing protein [Nitrospinae bacterium]|nr:DUF503 domain-containing protein [Nitrospinota bacterium]
MPREGKVFSATCLVTLALHGNSTLKGKRSVVNRLKSRIGNDFNVSVAEVGGLDRLQTALLGISAIGNDRVYLEGQMQLVVNLIERLGAANIADVQTTIEVVGSHAFI